MGLQRDDDIILWTELGRRVGGPDLRRALLPILDELEALRLDRCQMRPARALCRTATSIGGKISLCAEYFSFVAGVFSLI